MSNILIYGDSNTYGIIPGTWNRYETNKRYTGILKSKLSLHHIIEDGVVGRTTVYDDIREGKVGIETIEKSIKSSNPDLLIIMLGTNDLKKKNASNENILLNGIEKFTSKVNEFKGNAKVLLISPVILSERIGELDNDFDYNSYLLSKRVSEIYKRVAKNNNYLFLDSNEYVVAGVDGEHFDFESHSRLANGILKAISYAI